MRTLTWAQYTISVDDQDHELVASLGPLRVVRAWTGRPYPVVATGPKGKQAAFVGRVVAEAMGLLDQPGRIGFRDRNPLNCTRANLYRRGAPTGGKGNRTNHGQPPGIKRKAIGTDRPPAAYRILYHGQFAGIAERAGVVYNPSVQGYYQSWRAWLPDGSDGGTGTWREVLSRLAVDRSSDRAA